jgi:hypothetical protein
MRPCSRPTALATTSTHPSATAVNNNSRGRSRLNPMHDRYAIESLAKKAKMGLNRCYASHFFSSLTMYVCKQMTKLKIKVKVNFCLTVHVPRMRLKKLREKKFNFLQK